MSFNSYSLRGLEQIVQSASQDIVETVRSHLAMDLASEIRNDLDLELMTQAFIGAVSQCCRWWMLNQNEATKEQVLERISAVITDLMRRPV